MLEKQILTIVAVIKKMQLELKNNISIKDFNESSKELYKILKEIDSRADVSDIKDNIAVIEENEQKMSETHNALKQYIDDQIKELNDCSIKYQEDSEMREKEHKNERESRHKELIDKFDTFIKNIEEKLSEYVTKDSLDSISKDIDKKIKSIKIEPSKKITIGKVETISAGEDARVDIKETNKEYKLNFFIPRGVSGRGMPGKGVPSGGTTNQVLAKNSNDDYDTKWVSGGSGGTSDHSELTNLDYASAGHTGFQPAGNYVEDANYVHTDNNFTDAFETKLTGIEAGAEVNVQSDWNQTTNTADDYIKNKPTIPDAYVLPTASTTVKGGVKVDGTTITITDEVISAVTGGSGDVTGPTGATADNIAVFDGLTGKVIKDSGKKLSDYQVAGTYSTDIHSNITALNAVSGSNTGDQDLSSYATKTYAEAPPSFTLPSYTTTERDNLTPVNGMLIYNTTLNKFQGYEDSGWINLTSLHFE